MKIKIVKLIPSNQLPRRGSKEAAGWDVFCPRPVHLKRGDTVVLPLGFAAKIPDGYYASLVPRSSLGTKGITIPNAPATIDSDYTGQWHCGLVMHSSSKHEEYFIPEGHRICQIILHKYETIEWEEVDELPETERGEGGFGSTGK